ncbi:PHA/PHB synthase family protein [Candidatus Jidaibacter acanthamoebae]|nr:class I poly(R)-hydroxyalkanoic acid synthase [Candidatus Jidaibacter acanthamoeba]
MNTNYDSHKLSENLIHAFMAYQNAFSEMAANMADKMKAVEPDPFNLSDATRKAMQEIYVHPEKMFEHSLELYKDYLKLMTNVAQKAAGKEIEPEFKAEGKDNRFIDEAWENNPFFNFIKQAYYLNSAWVKDVMKECHNLDKKEIHKLDFFIKQFIDAMAPTNFPHLNPQVIKETLETNGENIAKGAENFLKDAIRSKGNFSIATTDFKAFKVGENLAITEGKVVYQNDLMQLIQYAPTTDKVKKVPLIMMPAWINKYYILDLKPQNSFVKWIVDKGYTVFMISWNNPDENFKSKNFEDYMKEGPLAALKVVQEITEEKEVNFLGYCLGGTLLACTLAYLKSKKVNNIKSATFLTTLIDFEECGDLGVFIDEEQLSMLENRMDKRGYLDGSEMAQTFSMLRANDMIWSFYVNNYLLGKEPFPFDILYWNADPTRLPSEMHSFYLRNMYQDNALIKPNGISLCGQGIDLSKIDLPTYVLSTREDHIAPWKATYKATSTYKGDVRFVLSASGHVAGVVNHPSKNKYNHWVNEKYDANPDTWFNNAKEVAGSWWLDWDKWLEPKSGELVEPRKINAKAAIEAAPGSYVKKQIV